MITEKIQLGADETILTLVRKHWFILCINIITLLGMAVLPLVAGLLLNAVLADIYPFFAGDYIPILVYLYIIWLLLLWTIGFNIWTNYYLDIWIVTNKRLIAVDQKGLFNRTTGSFRLERLQDLNVEVRGILATLLRYGTLEAQTAAGSEEEFKATGLPHPRELKALILKAADARIDATNDGV